MQIIEFPNDKHKRYFWAAYTAALLSSGVGGNKRGRFRLGAAIVDGKVLQTIKNNTGKTHPALLKYTIFPYVHAESNAILSHGLDNCEDTTLYVLRILKNKEIALAKPCVTCMQLIKAVGIKKIYYTHSLGYEEIVL